MFGIKNINLKFAFTMAEAIIVMIILGIIATIMITNLKPSEFRDKGLEILAKKNIEQIDQAIQQILINNTFDGKLDNTYQPNSSNLYQFHNNYSYNLELLKKYLTIKRTPYVKNNAPEIFNTMVSKSSSINSIAPPMYLKDGSLIYLGTGVGYGVSPTQSGTITIDGCEMPKNLSAIFTIDINGDDEPNLVYKDQYHIPIGNKGVDYDVMCKEAEVVNDNPNSKCAICYCGGITDFVYDGEYGSASNKYSSCYSVSRPNIECMVYSDTNWDCAEMY